MLTLVIVKMFIAIAIVSMGVACMALKTCRFGTDIWVGLFGMIAATIGFVTLRARSGRRCTMIAFMVVCIIASVADGVLIIFSSFLGSWKL